MSRKTILPIFVALISLLSTSKSMGVTLYTYTNGGSSGLWGVSGTWTTDPSGVSLVGSAVPGNNDVVNILNGFTVTLDANVTTTGLTININNGGTLDLATFTMATISSLSGAGTVRVNTGYFPAITTNNFVSSATAGATVEFYDFSGTLPASINYPNLTFTNTTTSNYTIAFANTAAYTLTIFGNLVTRATGAGTLITTFGTQATNIITASIRGNVTIGANTTLNTGTFNVLHSITITGNLTNNGTISLSNNTQYSGSVAAGAASLTFTGAADNTMACNGITNLYTLTINKGTGSANILSVTSTNVANLNFYSDGKLINVNAGTLRLGANINIPRVQGAGSANYDLGTSASSPMLWIDGATVNTNTAALVVYGKFRITAGTFICTGGQGTVIREEGQYIIEGGTFTSEKFRPSTTASTHRGSFTMTGGTVNLTGNNTSNGGYARFSLPYPEQVFIISGGTINVYNPEPSTSSGDATNAAIHIGCKTSNYNVTGGTFNAIVSGTASSYVISSTAPFWNLNISRTGGTPTTVFLNGIGSISGTITAAQPLVVLNDLTINGTNTPVLNASTQNVTVGRNFVINAGATYNPTTNITTFNGAADQLFTNNGTITGGLYNLTVSKSGGTLTLDGSASVFTVANNMILSGGILNDGGKSLRIAGNIENSAIHTGSGNITMNGTVTQNITGNGNGSFGNLILNNSSNPGALLATNLTISGTLTLAGTGNSLFDIEHYLLSLTSTSSNAITATDVGFSSNKMIRTLGLQSDRGVQKTYSNLSPFTFAFGAGTNYTPATIQITAAPASFGTITARPVNSRHQFVVAGNTNNLTWYWKVVSAGFTGLGATAVSHTYYYQDASVLPAGDDANYVPARYNPTTWTVISDVTRVNETTNVISFTSVNYIDGDFTAGVPAAFGAVKIFYSKRSGNWSDTGAGTTPWSNVSHSGPDATTTPGAGDQVFIGDGSTFNHSITITSNNQSAGGLEINTGSTLDVGIYTGHNFGRLENAQISGSGVLRISAATGTAEFPAGDFGNFIRSNGGTVEYYSTGAQNFTIPLISGAPTNLPLISYKNLVLAPATGRYIAMPAQDETIYGNMIVQGASATGIARLDTTRANQLTINGNLLVSSGNLQFQNQRVQSVSVDGNVTVSAGALFSVASANTAVTNKLSINGSLVNNGTIDLSNGTHICNTTFTGSVNTSITGTGTTTDFNILTVSKGTSISSILDVNASAFSLSGPTLPLVLNNGTFRLSSAQTVTIADGASFNIPATTRLSANGGTMELTGGNNINLLLAGTLEILAGTINVGTTANDNSIEYASTGQPTITASGGTLNVRAQIRRSSASAQGTLFYNQSGTSVISIGISSAATTTRGVFEILNTGSSFSMSGGILRINMATNSSAIADLYLQPTSYTITGGTIEIGSLATSAQIIDINTIIPLYNLSVTGTVNNTARLEANPLTLRGTLDIGAGNVFSAVSLNVSIAGDFVNSNTSSATGVTTGGYQPGVVTQTTTFNGSANHQNITGVSGNLTSFGNLVFNNTFTNGVITLQSNTNLRVNGILIFSSGTVAANANNITAVSTVSNSATHTSTTGIVLLGGSSNQIVTGNGSGKFGNLTLNNASNATFSANQEVTGTLVLLNGVINIGSYSLYLSNTSLSAISGASSSRYIVTSGRLSDGGITKAFAGSVTNGNFVFPIGVSGKYTPASYTITTGTTGGNVTIIPVNSKHPSATGSGTSFINYYWKVSHTITNLTALTHVYTYVAADESGIPADYRDARFSGGAWTIGITAGNPNTTTRAITFTNITDLNGDYTAGEATAFVNPTTYTSVATGNWETDAVWDIDPPGTNIGPPAGSFVIINEGHTVTITSNTRRMASVEVRGRLHVGTTTGHDFGAVTTSGVSARTIQIQSSTFPTGNFSSFNAAGGGTVEYDGSITLPTQATYNNLAFTSNGTKILSNVDLTINGNFTVAGGAVSNATSNRNITLNSSTGDFSNSGAFNAGTGTIIVGRNFTNSTSSGSFTAGNGTGGLRIAGNFSNGAFATFTAGTDSLGVRGSFTNNGTFTANTGAIRVSGNFSNSATGSFTGNSGIVSVGGSMTNNGNYNAGTGATTVASSYVNSGAAAAYIANSNTLTIGGDFTNSGAATFNAGTGAVQVIGNWTNAGSTFIAATGTVTFNSATARSLNGATSFYNLVRSGGGSLTLNNNITVSNALTMSGGNIITGTNVVTLTSTVSQPVTGYSASSFIDGRLSISYPNTAGTARFFPIGKGSIYRPVNIQQTAASTAPVVRVEMINTPPGGTYPASIQSLSETRYYSVNLVSGTMNLPIVELNFNTNAPSDEAVTVPGNMNVARATSSSGPWTDEGGSGVFSPTAPAGYVTSGVTSIASTTYFTLGYESTVLPISLGSFDAVLKNGVVYLNWNTFSEKNNDYFTIERSDDGITYDSISSTPGAGNSTDILYYQDIDRHPLTGVSYYRLRQTDYNGQYSYSRIVVITNDEVEESYLKLYPNPAQLGDKLLLQLESDKGQNAYTVITDMLGRVFFAGHLDLTNETDILNLNLNFKMERGMYLVSVTAGDFKEVRKVIVE